MVERQGARVPGPVNQRTDTSLPNGRTCVWGLDTYWRPRKTQVESEETRKPVTLRDENRNTSQGIWASRHKFNQWLCDFSLVNDHKYLPYIIFNRIFCVFNPVYGSHRGSFFRQKRKLTRLKNTSSFSATRWRFYKKKWASVASVPVRLFCPAMSEPSAGAHVWHAWHILW